MYKLENKTNNKNLSTNRQKSRAVADTTGQRVDIGWPIGSIADRRPQLVKNINQCAQLTIDMNGYVYNNLNGNGGFAEAYARHFHINPWEIPDLVWDYIVYAFNHNIGFNSYNQLVDQVLVGANNHLPLNPLYVDLNSRNTINMTGSRQNDYQAANQNYNNGVGWTWHHIEGINFNNGHWRCDMILANPAYHRQNHAGAVQQWQNATGNHYQ